MATSGSGELQVIRSSLLNVAGIWDQQATTTGTIPGKAGDLRLDRFDAGVFQLIVSPYDSVVNAIAARCAEGRCRMHEIATALRQCAENYARTEARLSGAANHAADMTGRNH